MDSKDGRGIVTRVKTWIDKNKGFFWACVIIVALFFLFLAGYPGSNPFLVFLFFGGCFLIAYLLKELMSGEVKLADVRNMLLDMAFEKCRCNPRAIITEAPDEPELVGQPIGKGYCHVCRSREFLEERFPGAIEELIQKRLNAFAFEESYIPEDLAASYFTPEVLAYLRERRLDRVGPERFVPLKYTVRKLRK
jgi:hypothetical protein